MSESQAWWQKRRIEQNKTGRWQIGPSTIWMRHLESEWQLVHDQAADPLQSDWEVTAPLSDHEQAGSPFGDVATTRMLRFVTNGKSDDVSVYPAMADRSIVVRPDAPFHVLPQQDIRFYVSTPLWLQIQIGNPPVMVRELPSFRLADTWFGPSTLEGELCYAMKTAGKLYLAQLPFRPHRAVTEIVVRNLSANTLPLERMKLPVQHLSLFLGANGYLWTQSAILEGDAPGQLAKAHLQPEPPDIAGPAEMLAGPRIPSRPTIVRRFTSLFGI